LPGFSLMEMAWGTCVSAAAAADGKVLMDWTTPIWQPMTYRLRCVRQRTDASSTCAHRQIVSY